MAVLKTSLFVALIAFLAHLTAAIPGQLIDRQTTCASIPGLTGSNTARSVSWPLDVRQTSTSTVSLATLLNQNTPCIPATVDVSSINASINRAQSSNRASAQSLFGFLKKVWQDVQDVVKVVKDLEAVIEWGDVVDIIKLGVDGWKLYNDVSHTFISAKSPDGSSTVTWRPVIPPRPRPDPPCGGTTRHMCP